MPIIFFGSILLTAVGIERLWYHFTAGRISNKLFSQFMRLIKENEYKKAFDMAAGSKLLVAEIMKTGIQHFNLSRSDAETAMMAVKEKMHELLRKRLVVFGTLSFVSPLLGLLGTVLGIMSAFQDVAISGSGGPTIIAAGVSEALITTVAGIAVAIPAAIIYNFFTMRTRRNMMKTEGFIDNLLILQYGKKKLNKN
ncbi:MAG: MotA/TolQ/ExbB proton channel family protein [Elusimicrobiota bacterium]